MSTAAAAAITGGLLWLLIWLHQRLAHGGTEDNERNLVLGLTWMDSGKFLVLPFALFLVAIVALYRTLPRGGRVAALTFAASALASVAVLSSTLGGPSPSCPDARLSFELIQAHDQRQLPRSARSR